MYFARVYGEYVAALKSRPKVQARANPSKRVIEPPKAPAGKVAPKAAAPASGSSSDAEVEEKETD